jgi:hypothetical protein
MARKKDWDLPKRLAQDILYAPMRSSYASIRAELSNEQQRRMSRSKMRVRENTLSRMVRHSGSGPAC